MSNREILPTMITSPHTVDQSAEHSDMNTDPDSEQSVTYPIFNFPSDQTFDASKITREDLLSNDRAFVLRRVFTPKECKSLIDQGEELGFVDMPETAHYRTNKRIVMQSTEFSDTLWIRVKPFVEENITVGPRDGTYHTGYFQTGEWEARGLNPVTRLCKYDPNNFFKAHYDEGYHPDQENVRTMKTCMVYLNSEFTGGETVFYFVRGSEPVRLKPEAGMCLIFNQKIWHEGATVTSGLKYFARTDIFYRKTAPGDFGEELTENQLLALDAYSRAMQFEADKKMDECCWFYRKAWRHDIDVEKVYYRLFIEE